jgi:hypothetical protein
VPLRQHRGLRRRRGRSICGRCFAAARARRLAIRSPGAQRSVRSGGRSVAAPLDEQALEQYLADLDHQVEAADELVRLALYLRYTFQPGPDVAQAEAARAELLFDSRLTTTLDAWSGQTVSTHTRRQLDLWRKHVTAARIRDAAPIRDPRTELNADIVAYRPMVGNETVSRG